MGYEKKGSDASFRSGEIRHAGDHKRKAAAELRSECRPLELSCTSFFGQEFSRSE